MLLCSTPESLLMTCLQPNGKAFKQSQNLCHDMSLVQDVQMQFRISPPCQAIYSKTVGIGNYGGSWQLQRSLVQIFPGLQDVWIRNLQVTRGVSVVSSFFYRCESFVHPVAWIHSILQDFRQSAPRNWAQILQWQLEISDGEEKMLCESIKQCFLLPQAV